MVEIRYRCASCAERLSVDEAAAGMLVRCPHCDGEGTVPRPGPPGRLLSVDVRFRCPACDRKVAVDLCHAGEVTACPACRAALTIPTPPAGPERTTLSPASVLSRDEVAFLMAR